MPNLLDLGSGDWTLGFAENEKDIEIHSMCLVCGDCTKLIINPSQAETLYQWLKDYRESNV